MRWKAAFSVVRAIRSKSSLSYVHAASSIPLIGDSIHAQFRETTARLPDRPLFVFREQNVRKTYADVYSDVQRLAGGLLHLGLERGDRVAIWAPNHYEWVLTQLTAAAAGMVLVNLSPAYQAAELKFALRKVGVKAIVLPRRHRRTDFYDILAAAVPEIRATGEGIGAICSGELPELKHAILFGNHDGEKLRGVWSFDELMEAGGSTEEHELNEIGRCIQPDDPANIEFTSGTTGNPKAVVLSHHNIVNNANLTGLSLGFNQELSTVCIPNPLFHCFACVVGVVSSLIHGATCVFPAASVIPERTIEAMSAEKCTTVYGTPTMMLDVLNVPTLHEYDLQSTHTALVAGSPVPAALVAELTRRTALKNVVIGYGCTEMTTAVSLSRPTDPLAKRMATVGHVTPHLELSIQDAEGRILPRGQAGEICTRGYSRMRGYWNDPKATTATISSGGWFHTGDVGCLNDDESLSVVGRLKDMIIRGGENISPAEIEDLIAHHPLVRDVQVVGVPDDRMGEEVCAVVQLKAGGSLDEAQLKAFCRERISHYKCPRYVLFKPAAFFPRTPTGKIKKTCSRSGQPRKSSE
ncbi:hypothetical protein M3Y99_01681900 [Aphelenchoides fujianensis]|nr:hypothetical protein M3Y99_01681900 [Aphelenchoides fujianensis]